MSQHQKNSVRKLVSKSLPKSNGEPINGFGKVERNQPNSVSKKPGGLNPRARIEKGTKTVKPKPFSPKVVHSTIPKTISSGESLIQKVIDTGKSVISDIGKVAASDPTVLLTAPSTLMKVVDVTTGIIKSVKGTDDQKTILSGPVVTKKDEQILKQISQTQPVINTTVLPSSTSTNVVIPKMQTVNFNESGRRGMHVTGSYLVGNVQSYETDDDCWWNPGIGGALVSGMNSSLFGDRAFTIFQLFQKIRFNGITLTFVPQRGMDYVGNIMMSIADGIDQPMGGSVTMSVVSQRDNVLFSDLKTPSSLSVKGLGNWLWSNNTASNDMKFFSDQKLGVCVYNTANDGETPGVFIDCGQILVTYDIDLLSATESATSLSDVVTSALTRAWLSTQKPQLTQDTYLLLVSAISKIILKKMQAMGENEASGIIQSAASDMYLPQDFHGLYGNPVTLLEAIPALASLEFKKKNANVRELIEFPNLSKEEQAVLLKKAEESMITEEAIRILREGYNSYSVICQILSDAEYPKYLDILLREVDVRPEDLFDNVFESILYFLRDVCDGPTWFADTVKLIEKIAFRRYRLFNPVTISQQIKLEEEYENGL